ncbi:hypothetical protein D3C73_1395430 [compost metagenome]
MNWNWYPAPTVAPLAGAVMATWGAVRSAVTVCAAAGLTFPAESVLRILKVWAPAVVSVNVSPGTHAWKAASAVESTEHVSVVPGSKVAPRTGLPLTT